MGEATEAGEGVGARRDDVDRVLALFPMDEYGTGHIADCGYDANDERCDCATLPTRIAALLDRVRRESESTARRGRGAPVTGEAIHAECRCGNRRAALVGVNHFPRCPLGEGEPDTGDVDVEALATAISEGIHARGYHLSPPLVDDVTRTILASDWLTGLRQNAAQDRAEQIAQELERKARVARSSKAAVPEDFERADVTRGNFDQQAWAFEQAARVAREFR